MIIMLPFRTVCRGACIPPRRETAALPLSRRGSRHKKTIPGGHHGQSEPLLYAPVHALYPACSLRNVKCSLQPKSFHVYGYIHRPSDNFPPMPWFVKLLCNWVWYWSDRNMWRFAPTLSYGVPHSTYLPPALFPSNAIECASYHNAHEPLLHGINSFSSRRV